MIQTPVNSAEKVHKVHQVKTNMDLPDPSSAESELQGEGLAQQVNQQLHQQQQVTVLHSVQSSYLPAQQGHSNSESASMRSASRQISAQVINCDICHIRGGGRAGFSAPHLSSPKKDRTSIDKCYNLKKIFLRNDNPTPHTLKMTGQVWYFCL